MACLICTACFAASPAAACRRAVLDAHPSRSALAQRSTVQPTANGGDRGRRAAGRVRCIAAGSASCSGTHTVGRSLTVSKANVVIFGLWGDAGRDGSGQSDHPESGSGSTLVGVTLVGTGTTA